MEAKNVAEAVGGYYLLACSAYFLVEPQAAGLKGANSMTKILCRLSPMTPGAHLAFLRAITPN